MMLTERKKTLRVGKGRDKSNTIKIEKEIEMGKKKTSIWVKERRDERWLRKERKEKKSKDMTRKTKQEETDEKKKIL